MVSFLALVLVQGEPKSIQELPAWKLYASNLAQASQVEFVWEKIEDDRHRNHFTLRVNGRHVSLERRGGVQTVWNGTSGIEIDHGRRTYTVLLKRPAFIEASFLEVPGVLEGKGNQASHRVGQKAITAGDRPIDCISATMHMIDAAVMYTYWFEGDPSLLSFYREEYRGMWEGGEKTITYRVYKRSLDADLPDDAFSTKPPPGYFEVPPVLVHPGLME